MICSYGKCKAEPKWRFSPDIDIQGLLTCDKHLDTVRMAYMTLMTGNEDLCYQLLNREKETQQIATLTA
jgi:hypothetical protein